MIYIDRPYKLNELLESGKVLIIYGARRVGKTTLMQKFLEDTKLKYRLESGDNIRVQNILSSSSFEEILEFVEGLELLVIDEAQNIPNIGQALKIIVDQRPDIKVLVTGSSSFDLSNKVGEPLVGRKITYTLFPFSLFELKKLYSKYEIKQKLEEYLIYGLYPKVFTTSRKEEKEKTLRDLVESYLLKDIFTLEKIQAPRELLHLLKILALQIGQPVSPNKLSNEVGLNLKTVNRYLDLLEKTFVIKRIEPFTNNRKGSLKLKPKFYFLDLGVRNAILNNFTDLQSRPSLETGHMWENFIFIERIKSKNYENKNIPNFYYYRSYESEKEIDMLEEHNGLKAFEFKTELNHIAMLPEWENKLIDNQIKVINKENFFDFI